jgi:transposase-like protein
MNKNLLDSFDESKFLCPACKKYYDKNENFFGTNNKIICTSCLKDLEELQNLQLDEMLKEEWRMRIY